ncbi:MAG: hypothetical protein K2X35_09320 [Bryobacteraceae bacterium]|nr:hypothetical protein [Bryobacteraceae bacterium]
MTQNFDRLRDEILEYLEGTNLGVFLGIPPNLDGTGVVAWNVEVDPDYRRFLKAAEKAGARIVVFHATELTPETVDETAEELEALTIERDERRELESKLKDARKHVGSTGAIELSFTVDSRVYVFEIRTDWFSDFLDIEEALEMYFPSLNGEEDDSMGGYFSRN